jgi:hypothetical protein
MLIAPNGQAQTHSLHAMHLSRSTTTEPVLELLEIAFIGQTTMHGAGSHCSQIIGTPRQMPSFFGTHIRVLFKLKSRSLADEHATMHALQLVHDSKSRNRAFWAKLVTPLKLTVVQAVLMGVWAKSFNISFACYRPRSVTNVASKCRQCTSAQSICSDDSIKAINDGIWRSALRSLPRVDSPEAEA